MALLLAARQRDDERASRSANFKGRRRAARPLRRCLLVVERQGKYSHHFLHLRGALFESFGGGHALSLGRDTTLLRKMRFLARKQSADGGRGGRGGGAGT